MENYHVTDHAIIRFMERVQGIDRETLEQPFRNESIAAAIEAGALGITIDGVYFKLDPGTKCVISVLAEKPTLRYRGHLKNPTYGRPKANGG